MLRILMIACGLCLLLGAAGAKEMQLTIYDDGKSCPGNCDAHVVINPSDNGTRFAFRPGSTRTNPLKCTNGQTCNICFAEPDNSCMEALYRGGGPPAGKFDFPPAFYAANCGQPSIPSQLQAQCDAMDQQVVSSGYDQRINCFLDQQNPKCVDVLANATAAQAADNIERDKCLQLGQSVYNNQQPTNKTKRALGCNYSFLSLGGNGNWKLLMPGSCRTGTFVGRDGLDCCNSDPRFAVTVHPECTPYFRRPN